MQPTQAAPAQPVVVDDPAHRTVVHADVAPTHSYMGTIAGSAFMGGAAGALIGGAIYFLGNQTHPYNIAYWAAGGVLVGTGVGITQIMVQESRVVAGDGNGGGSGADAAARALPDALLSRRTSSAAERAGGGKRRPRGVFSVFSDSCASGSNTSARNASATLQACAMQPRGANGGSASQISLIVPMHDLLSCSSRPPSKRAAPAVSSG